jgi:hypothetical protein
MQNPKMKTGTDVEGILKFCLSNLNNCNVVYSCLKRFKICATEMGSGGMIWISRFLKTGTGVEALLRFSLNNLRGCNVGITNGIIL